MTSHSNSNVVELINAIDSRIRKVHTQSLDLSFNELLDMHKSTPKELDIRPEYQRLFQWSEGARSRFIESLLLEMPVPPVYVIEEEEGKYLLIDGLQRISSYLHFRGELLASHLDPPVNLGDKLRLCDCDIVEELNGKTFDELGTALQIRVKRAFVRVEVVRKGSDPRFKYHMFKRLNTGGQILTSQQLRNCTIRLLDTRFNDFIVAMSEVEAFKTSCSQVLTRERKLGAFDQELVLRFFAFKNARDDFKHDVDDFLTEYMESIADSSIGRAFDFESEETIFRKTFTIFERTLEDRSFCYANKTRTSLTLGFSVYHFEALTVGIQSVLHRIDVEDAAQIKLLTEAINQIKLAPEFIDLTTGGGKNSPGPLRRRIGFVEDRLSKTL